ncbi:NifU family protein [bacterium]|nr:NifU family protein [bacterium]
MSEHTTALTDVDKSLVESVSAILKKYRPVLQSEGGDAELISIKDGIVHIRMTDSGCAGCGSTPMAMLEPGMRATIMEKVKGLRDIVFER